MEGEAIRVATDEWVPKSSVTADRPKKTRTAVPTNSQAHSTGCQPDRADVVADGSALPFRTGSFDSLIARHNLEHYVDTAGTLIEWARVLDVGGRWTLDEKRIFALYSSRRALDWAAALW